MGGLYFGTIVAIAPPKAAWAGTGFARRAGDNDKEIHQWLDMMTG